MVLIITANNVFEFSQNLVIFYRRNLREEVFSIFEKNVNFITVSIDAKVKGVLIFLDENVVSGVEELDNCWIIKNMVLHIEYDNI
jgi:hypothetical protein